MRRDAQKNPPQALAWEGPVAVIASAAVRLPHDGPGPPGRWQIGAVARPAVAGGGRVVAEAYRKGRSHRSSPFGGPHGPQSGREQIVDSVGRVKAVPVVLPSVPTDRADLLQKRRTEQPSRCPSDGPVRGLRHAVPAADFPDPSARQRGRKRQGRQRFAEFARAYLRPVSSMFPAFSPLNRQVARDRFAPASPHRHLAVLRCCKPLQVVALIC